MANAGSALSARALLLVCAIVFCICGLLTFSTMSDLQHKVVLREFTSSKENRQQIRLSELKQEQLRLQRQLGKDRKADKAEYWRESSSLGKANICPGA